MEEGDRPREPADGGEDGAAAGRRPLFSAFNKPKPKAATPAPKPPPRQEAYPPPAPSPAAPPPEPPRQQDAEILSYLKSKVTQLEANLREAQEKGLSFALELKAREEARKESRREMEEFLGAVRQQQAAAEADRQRSAEADKYRERISALEARLLQISETPAGVPPGLESRLSALENSLAAMAAKPAPPDRITPLQLKLEVLEEKCKLLEARPASPGISAELEILRERLEKTENMLLGRLQQSELDLNKLRRDLYTLCELSDQSAADTLTALDQRLRELRDAARYLASAGAAAGAEAYTTVEWLEDYMERNGESAARRAAGAYDLGFIRASIENLEKVFDSAVQELDREASRDAAGALSGLFAGMRRGLENFKSSKQAALKALRKRLGGG